MRLPNSPEHAPQIHSRRFYLWRNWVSMIFSESPTMRDEYVSFQRFRFRLWQIYNIREKEAKLSSQL